MASGSLSEKLRAGQVAIGLGVMYPAAGIIEGMCRGWDWVWIDGQHGQYSYDSILHAVQVADATGVASVVRVPGHEHGFLGPYADTCPAGILVPMVNTADEARHVADGLRFPPVGKRSYGGRRVIDLGGREYYLNQQLLVVAQIETAQAVENAEAIIAVKGVDALFFGPDDMKTQLGIPINTPITDNQQLRKAMAETARAARDAGKFCGTVAGTTPAFEMAVEMGYQLLIGGGDVGFLRTAASQKLQELRAVLARPKAKG